MKIVYEQNGKTHEVSREFFALASSICWRAFENAGSPAEKKAANDLHGIICALIFGKVKVHP